VTWNEKESIPVPAVGMASFIVPQETSSHLDIDDAGRGKILLCMQQSK